RPYPCGETGAGCQLGKALALSRTRIGMRDRRATAGARYEHRVKAQRHHSVNSRKEATTIPPPEEEMTIAKSN
ncbi:MAG TPA: hypothetical protein VGL77_19180, partial [Armatimonadota bacterium]